MINSLSGIWTYILFALLLTGCWGGCSSQKTTKHNSDFVSSDPLVLIIKNRTDETSAAISSNISYTLNYAGIPFQSYDLSLSSSDLNIRPSVKTIYLTTNALGEMNDKEVEYLVAFAAAGHQLVILTPIFDQRFSYLLGLKKNTDYTINKQAEGYKFKQNIFPDFKGRSVQTKGIYLHNGFDGSEFISKKNVIASAIDDSTYPVISERAIGKGESIYFNTSTMTDKEYRGLMFSAGLKGLQGIPYRIANVCTIFLDDFPAPLYDRKSPPIAQEYNLTEAHFVKDIWWPEMKELADKYDISYTTMLAFNYNAVVVPPFDFDEWKASKMQINGESGHTSAWLAQDVKNSRHELGFHGYNHFSLWEQDWQNKQYMQSALQAAKKQWRIDDLGKLPRTYVPPTNEIDSLGLVSIKKAMSSIKIMSSLYNGVIEEGGGREFGPDPMVPQLFDYPRITSGYVDNDNSSFHQQSLFLYTGIWTHFIHPDDVFQVSQRSEDDFKSRNPLGLGWHESGTHDYGLYEVFERRLQETINKYPFIRFKTASQAVPVVKNWLSSKTRYESTPKR